MSSGPLARRHVIFGIFTSSLVPGLSPLQLTTLGEQRVQREVERASTVDFIQLSRLQLLPQVTRNYVPAVLSAMQLLGVSYLPVEPQSSAKQNDLNGIIFAAPGAQP